MEHILNPIIEAYGAHGADEVECNGQLLVDAFTAAGQPELMEHPDYPLLKDLVKRVQEDLEYFTEQANLDKDKVVESLKLIFAYVEAPEELVRISHEDYEFKLDACHKIILRNFERWNINHPRLIRHFEFWFPKIRDWNFYFISYTNKGAYELNNAYGTLFHQYHETLDASDRIIRKHNNFSKLLHLYLVKENLRRGFYDKDYLRDGDDFAKEIEENLKNSFVFIQVITRTALWNVRPNWPFKEYKRFVELNKAMIEENVEYRGVLEKRFRFIACSENENSVYPAGGVPLWLRRWKDHFERIQHGPMITPSITKQQLDDQLYKLCRNVTHFIKEEAIATIPED